MALTNVEIVDVATKGRGLLANKKFETGQLVLRQQPYAYVVMSAHADAVCHYCLASPPPDKQAKPLAKCTACKYARYCSKECQKKAWPDHKPECSAMQRVNPGKPVDQTRLVARILWRKQKDAESGAKQLVEIETLEDHLDKRNKEEKDALDEKVYSFGDYFTYDEMPESDQEMLHLFATIDCNAVGLNDHRNLQAIGVGIFPVASLLNHDCNANCVAMNNGTKLEIRALRKIEKDEELCICYVDCLNTTEQRKEKLMSQYYFDCKCQMCEDGHEIESLKHGLVREDMKEESIKYINQFSKDMLKRIQNTKDKQNWERMSNQALGTLAQQDCVISDTHVLKIAVLNHAVEVQSYLRRQDSALEFARRVADAYEKLLPPVHPTLGMYFMRLGILQWQLQQNETATKTLGKSASIISKTFGEDHPVFVELLGLIKQCRMESYMSKNAQRQFRLAKKKAGLGLPSV
ncbi:histone-lysine N-methyltransferase SMYD1-like [Clavelina lepadiformis]|uniref:[histone H3]-lysine(4) N-trimethyltransferase n=1 Tax=Clavelina lepadiformis TaxID=159417 RepID=A0ABP0EY32_CLALP